MECVGTKESMETAVAIACQGGSIGYVGVPHGSEQLDPSLVLDLTVDLDGVP
jgi:threonine dehydrogenase-like Zn-dependent dehydrogenase